MTYDASDESSQKDRVGDFVDTTRASKRREHAQDALGRASLRLERRGTELNAVHGDRA